MNNLLRSLDKKQGSLGKKNPESLIKFLQKKTSTSKELVRAFYYVIIKEGIKKRMLKPKAPTFSQDIKLTVDDMHQNQDRSLVRFLVDKLKREKNKSVIR